MENRPRVIRCEDLEKLKVAMCESLVGMLEETDTRKDECEMESRLIEFADSILESQARSLYYLRGLTGIVDLEAGTGDLTDASYLKILDEMLRVIMWQAERVAGHTEEISRHFTNVKYPLAVDGQY